MKKNIEEKSLISIKEGSIFNKIKIFFIKLFKKDKGTLNEVSSEEVVDEVIKPKDMQREEFLKYVKNVENEATKLLKLQKQFDEGIIDVDDLTQEQKEALIDLYKKQIVELCNSNEFKQIKVQEYESKNNN